MSGMKMMGSFGDVKMCDNLLTRSWNDPSWLPSMLNSQNVMDYFCEQGNFFYDRQSNNEMLRMQRAPPDQLMAMTGLEYCLLYAQEPILYVIRKQNRHAPNQATPIADYYIIDGVIYQAPDLGSVLNSRLLTAVNHLQAAFEEARGYAKYHPTRGYWWDFGLKKSGEGGEINLVQGNKKKKKSDKKKKKRKTKEEPSSLFQRRRVDMLLDQLIRRFPFKVNNQPQNAASTNNTTSNESENKDSERGVKREASKPETANNKKLKLT